MLTPSTHAGKISVTQRLRVVTNSSTIATAYVTNASQRGMTPVRSHIVRQRDQQHPGHPQRVDVADLQHHRAPERRDLGTALIIGEERHGGDDPARDRRRDEDHRQEQQTASDEDGGEELILGVLESVADDPHEPEERDARERHEAESDADAGRGARIQPVRVAGERLGRR